MTPWSAPRLLAEGRPRRALSLILYSRSFVGVCQNLACALSSDLALMSLRRSTSNRRTPNERCCMRPHRAVNAIFHAPRPHASKSIFDAKRLYERSFQKSRDSTLLACWYPHLLESTGQIIMNRPRRPETPTWTLPGSLFSSRPAFSVVRHGQLTATPHVSRDISGRVHYA